MSNRELFLSNLLTISNLFYQLQVQEATSQLVSFIENIDLTALQNDFADEELVHMQNVLLECVQVLPNKDYILIADLIQYEIVSKINV